MVVAKAPAIATPIVKWVGGKTKLLSELAARMPKKFGRYYEPFVGGGALFFRVAPKRAVLNDLNIALIDLYYEIAHNVDGLIEQLELHRDLHCEDYYYSIRANWNAARGTWTASERAAAFLYLNKTCYNGLWRVNQAGDFNVPAGRYTNPPICVPEALRAVRAMFSRTKAVELRCTDYHEAVADAARGDFLYMDPPYDPITPTANFTSYTPGHFGVTQQRELGAIAHRLVEKGCYVMLSNSDTPLIRTIYQGFKIECVKAPRAINSDATKRGLASEVIITGGY